MQITDGNNENNPTSPSHQLSPILQIPKHEPLASENSTQEDFSWQSPPRSQSQNPIHRHPSSSLSSSQSSTNASNSVVPATTTTTIMSNSVSSSSKNLLCGPPQPTQLLSSTPWLLTSPPQHQPPPCHQPPMIPYYPPMEMPPPFPMPFFHDQFHSFHHPMLLGNNNDNAFNGQIYSQPWSTGLLDCFSDMKNCFITCLCPCVTFGQVDEILSQGQMAWWEAALMFGLLETLCCPASLVFAWYHRVQFRKKYNLMGNLLSEFAITLFCMRLVLCQNYRQLNKLGFDVALGWEANKKKQRRIASQNAVQFVPPMANPGMFR